jgi:hypothetical protein
MSLSHETMLEIMALADGELEGTEKERVERLVASSHEARQVYADLCGEEVSAWLAESLDQRAAAGGSDRIAGAVMDAIASGAANGVSARPPAQARPAVASLDDRRARMKPRLQYVAVAGGAFLALAAGLIIYVGTQAQHLAEHAPVASVRIPSVDVQAPAMAAVQPGGGGVEVNEIDAPSVSVFEIPAGAAAAVKPSGPSSVVIWVDDDPGAK